MNRGSFINPNNNSINPGAIGDCKDPNAYGINQGSNTNPNTSYTISYNNSIDPGIRGEGKGPNTHGINQGSNINPKTGKPYEIGD